MKYQYVPSERVEEVIHMFNLMNKISNSFYQEYIEEIMKRYEFIAQIFNLSIETVRKIFQGTRILKWFQINSRYRIQIKYYEYSIYLKRLNSKKEKSIIRKINKEKDKHKEVTKFILDIAKATNNKLSAKVLSRLIQNHLNLYYSPKHLYFLIRNNKMEGVTLRIFPYLKYGKYYKKPKILTKKFVSTPIHQRDEIINQRLRYGDVEIDTVEGIREDQKYISTMIDRKSRRLSATLYETKSSTKFLEAVKQNISKMNQPILSLTSDNGIENVKLDELNLPWFSTNAYSSWQKGTIEQKHRQIRKFIPKGKSFEKLTQEMLDLIVLTINAETYLQNPHKYELGKIITIKELKIYYQLITSKEPNQIFKLN